MIKKPHQYSASRRAFLRGPRRGSPWEQFIRRLQRCISGEFTVLNSFPQASVGRLIVQSNQDVYHLLDLAKLYDVKLALDGYAPEALADGTRLVIMVPGSQLSRLKPLDTQKHRWFIGAGVCMHELVAAGLEKFEDLPPTLTVGQWIASPRWMAYPTGQTQQSGVIQARVCLSDATPLTLGPFAADDKQALQGWRSQALVSQLFRLTYATELASYLLQSRWLLRYRLDALKAKEVNLAQILLGHQGSLGWLEWLLLDYRQLQFVNDRDCALATPSFTASAQEAAVVNIDNSIKQAFDPDDIFTTCG